VTASLNVGSAVVDGEADDGKRGGEKRGEERTQGVKSNNKRNDGLTWVEQRRSEERRRCVDAVVAVDDGRNVFVRFETKEINVETPSKKKNRKKI
jgi:hypothetical protein